MTIRTTLFVIVMGLLATVGCGGPTQNKVMADTPALPYQAPDIAEITGIDEDEEPAEEDEPAEEPAPAPAPQPAAAPAAPATPAAPAAKAPAPAKAPGPAKAPAPTTAPKK